MTPETQEQLESDLRRDEGVRSLLYRDSLGNPTIGCGHLVLPHELGSLSARLLTGPEITALLRTDIAHAEAICRTLWVSWDGIDGGRQAALCNMAFNLGSRLGLFYHLIAAVNTARWNDAADAALDSEWAKQVGERAQRIAAALRGGHSTI